MSRIGGIISFAINGQLYEAKGAFDYNLGRPLREAVIGSSGPAGYKETPQVAFIEGAITDGPSIDLGALVELTEQTVTLALANGKVVVIRDAWFAAEGTGNTDEGEIAVRFESKSPGEEVA